MRTTDIDAQIAEASRLLVALEDRVLIGDTSVTINEIEAASKRLSQLESCRRRGHIQAEPTPTSTPEV